MNEKYFRELSGICDELCIKKNRDYGDNNIVDLGPKGLFPRIYDKIMRLKTLLWENKLQNVKDETIRDTILDLRNYAQILLAVLDKKFK